MPENDFEKQVQQLFGEMKLKPSAEVWSRVHERIRKNNRRKRALIWIPLMLLLLGAGSFWLLEHNNKLQITTADSVAGNVKHENSEKEINHLKGAENANNGNTDKLVNEQQKSTASLNTAPPVSTDVAEDDISNKKSNYNKTEISSASHQQLNKKTKKLQLNLQSGATESVDNKSDIAFQKHQAKRVKKTGQPEHYNNLQSGIHPNDFTDNGDKSGENNFSSTPVVAIMQTVAAGSTVPVIETEKQLTGIPSENPFKKTTKPVVKLAKKKAFEWGVSGEAGASMLSDGFSLFGNNTMEKPMQYSSPVNSATGQLVGQGQNTLAALPAPPSTIKTGFAWKAGGFGKWYFSEKVAFTAGLNYSYYSTNRQVGNAINPNILSVTQDANFRFAASYSGASSSNYTNKYHFVELPVGIQWQFNKGLKLPLQLDAGLSIGYLAGSTALHYDKTTGVYYEDESLFNKVQGGIYAGFSAKLFQHSQRPLYIGPVFQYNFTNLLKPVADLHQNFIYGGIKAQWVLFKK